MRDFRGILKWSRICNAGYLRLPEWGPDRRMFLKALFCLAVIAGTVLFFRLGANPLQSWDESVYAQSAKEMVQTGDYLTPRWNGELFLQKPPLALWATALVFRVGGVNELTARAVSALCGVGCVLVTFLIGSTFLSKADAFVAGLILLITPHFFNYARQGSMEVPLTFFMLLCLFAFLKAKESPRWWLLFGISAGLAVMTKGIAAAPLLIAVLAVLLFAGLPVWKLREFWVSIGLLIAIGGAWHLAMLALYGSEFFNEYVGKQIFARSAHLVDGQAQKPTFYLTILALGFLPFSLLLPFAAARIYRRRAFPMVLLIFAGVMIVVYSAVATKHPWYVVPVFPVFALMLASLRWKRIMALLAIGAIMHCALLDRFLLVSYEQQRIAVAQAQAGSGPFVTDMNVAPTVLFYSDRKICTLDSDRDAAHSMRPLTVCR